MEFFLLSRVTWRELRFGAFFHRQLPPSASLTTGHYPLAPRPTPPPYAGTSGVRSCARPSPAGYSDTNRGITKDRTGLDPDEHPLYFILKLRFFATCVGGGVPSFLRNWAKWW